MKAVLATWRVLLITAVSAAKDPGALRDHHTFQYSFTDMYCRVLLHDLSSCINLVVTVLLYVQ